MYIIDSRVISPQDTISGAFENGLLTNYAELALKAIEPSYQDLIPNSLLRRMGKAVRMGIGAGLPLLAKYPETNGIILGTANGGLEDCIKFLNQLVEYEEGILTPTNFVQSTPNAVAGQLALMTENRSYNTTHTGGSFAFENALTDAALVLEEHANQILLLGGIEEISDYNYHIDYLNNLFKTTACSSLELLENANTNGTNCGEGAAFFVLSNEASNALVKITHVAVSCFEDENELTDFLAEMSAKGDSNTLFLSGENGDLRLRPYYTKAKEIVNCSRVETFKQYCGEYRTATAFGLYYGMQRILGNMHPEKNPDQPDSVVLYSTFDGFRHSLIRLERV